MPLARTNATARRTLSGLASQNRPRLGSPAAGEACNTRRTRVSSDSFGPKIPAAIASRHSGRSSEVRRYTRRSRHHPTSSRTERNSTPTDHARAEI